MTGTDTTTVPPGGPSPFERRSVLSSPRTRWLLAAVSAAVIAPTLFAIRHVPTPFPDLQFYAGIARARQLYGIGVPIETWNSPSAIDHIPFYGPVFFDLCAAALGVFGVSLLSFRLVSILGMAMVVSATALMSREVSDSSDRWLWVVALLVLAPELNLGVGTGVMHLLAVGFQMLALAVFVRGLRHPVGRSLSYGTVAGFMLAMAAMTTPRSYLFVAAFFASWVLLPLSGHAFRRESRWQCVAAAVGFGVPFLGWIVYSHGDPVRWARYMAYIAMHEDTDVAILPTAVRGIGFTWTPAITPIAALIGGLMAGRGIRRERRWSFAQTSGAAFALLTTFMTYVLTVVILNYTFANGEYFALPLFAVVAAMPTRVFGVSDRTLAAIVALTMVCDAGLFAVKVARTAATWNASDPSPLNEFIRSHVPPGSVVVGPQAPYFFPVERNGSRYRTVLARSWGDWARWVPIVEPEAVFHAARIPEPPPAARFFIWQTDDIWPPEYDCVRGHVAGAFQPAPTYLHLLGRLGHPTDQGYPPSTLYRLPPGCPTGYDPTVGH